jgi:hypothetical protein
MFHIAFASVPGTDHTMPGQPGWKNNQDAHSLRKSDSAYIGIICDGCSSGKQSEVGASLGAELFAESLNRQIQKTPEKDIGGLLESALSSMLKRISRIAKQMGGDFKESLTSYFLFTIVGIVITEKLTSAFVYGDGLAGFNGEITTYESPGNAPAYPTYRLIPEIVDVENQKFSIQTIETTALENALIGSDGAEDLFSVDGPRIPLDDGLYFKNKDILRRRLALLNQDRIEVRSETSVIRGGPLRDDTTLILIRRKP